MPTWNSSGNCTSHHKVCRSFAVWSASWKHGIYRYDEARRDWGNVRCRWNCVSWVSLWLVVFIFSSVNATVQQRNNHLTYFNKAQFFIMFLFFLSGSDFFPAWRSLFSLSEHASDHLTCLRFSLHPIPFSDRFTARYWHHKLNRRASPQGKRGRSRAKPETETLLVPRRAE